MSEGPKTLSITVSPEISQKLLLEVLLSFKRQLSEIKDRLKVLEESAAHNK